VGRNEGIEIGGMWTCGHVPEDRPEHDSVAQELVETSQAEDDAPGEALKPDRGVVLDVVSRHGRIVASPAAGPDSIDRLRVHVIDLLQKEIADDGSGKVGLDRGNQAADQEGAQKYGRRESQCRIGSQASRC
jgi:hypothetical protein